MYSAILFFHVLFCLILLGLILIQRSKASDVGSSFGAGASTSMFGSSGATSFLVKLSAAFGILFFATSLTLGIMSTHMSSANSTENAALAAASKVAPMQPSQPVAPMLPQGAMPK